VINSSNILSIYGGVETLLMTLREFSNYESVQTTALFALGSVVTKSCIMIFNEATHRQCVLKNGGIEMILKSMSANYDQKNGSCLLM
jgi:hypothetical protein